MHWNCLRLLRTNDDQNILPLTVMCGITFCFYFVCYIKIFCMVIPNYWTSCCHYIYMYINNCTIIRYSDAQICGSSPTCFGHFQGGIQQRTSAKMCRRFTTCFYTIVSNYSTVVGIYIVTCLTAQNRDNFKQFLLVSF